MNRLQTYMITSISSLQLQVYTIVDLVVQILWDNTLVSISCQAYWPLLKTSNLYLLVHTLPSIDVLCTWRGFKLSTLYVMFARFIKLPQFYFMELHYKGVTLRSQIRSKSTYNYTIVQGTIIHIYGTIIFVVVLVFFCGKSLTYQLCWLFNWGAHNLLIIFQ